MGGKEGLERERRNGGEEIRKTESMEMNLKEYLTCCSPCRFPPLRPCRDSMRERRMLLSPSPKQALGDDKTGALTEMLGKLDLNGSATRPVGPDSNLTQVGSKPVVGRGTDSDLGTPV